LSGKGKQRAGTPLLLFAPRCEGSLQLLFDGCRPGARKLHSAQFVPGSAALERAREFGHQRLVGPHARLEEERLDLEDALGAK
jgi:hypothetical protein